MKIGTHNSLSGYKVKNWWFKLINFTSKCQSKTIKEQLDAGCRWFDIRLRWYKGKLYAAHGLMIYDVTFEEFLNEVYVYNTTDTIYYRVMYEDAIGHNNAMSYEEFESLVLAFVALYSKDNIVITEIGSKSQGKWTVFKDISQYHKYYYKGIKQLLGIPYPALGAEILKDFNPNISMSTYLITDFL